MIGRPTITRRRIFVKKDVAHALKRAASALMPTPATAALLFTLLKAETVPPSAEPDRLMLTNIFVF